MTYVLQNNWVTTFSSDDPYRRNAAVNPVITIDSRDPYNPETVAKIIDAHRGPNARAPADKDKFLDWLVR